MEKYIRILTRICDKYDKSRAEGLDKLLQIEEQLHIKEMDTGTAITFNKSYFYHALGKLQEQYKQETK